MPVVDNVKAPEQFLHNINGDYSLLFDVIEVEANTALPEGTVLEYAAGSGEPIPVVLQDTEAVFGTKERTVADYANLISAAIPDTEAQSAVYGEKQGEYAVELGYAPMVPDYDNLISPAVEAQPAVPAVYGTKTVTVPDYDNVIKLPVVDGIKYGLKEEQAEDQYVILEQAVAYQAAVPEVPPVYGQSEQYNIETGEMEMMEDTSIIITPAIPAIPEVLAKPAVYGTQTIKVIDLTQAYPQEFLPAAGGGWVVKSPTSNSTKLGILAESVKASNEAQKVKVAIRSNAFNSTI